MKQRILFFLFFFFLFLNLSAKKSPLEIKYMVMDLNALRYYPFKVPADSIIEKLLEETDMEQSDYYNKKTVVDFMGNREFIQGQVSHSVQANDFLYKYLIRPYISWYPYAAPLKEDNRDIVWTLGLHQDIKEEDGKTISSEKGIYGFLGEKNVDYLIDEIFEDIDLFKPFNHVMFLSVKSPLAKKGINSYRYFLSSTEELNGEKVHEIVFYPKNIDKSGFTGYLYITTSEPYQLKKAVFSLSNSYNMNFIKDILFIQTFFPNNNKLTPLKKEYIFSLGDEMKGSLVVNRRVNFTDSIEPLTASETIIDQLVETSKNTTAYNNLKTVTRLLLTDYYSINGERGIFELGPITQMLSYNKLEGFRFRLGGNTTLNLNKHLLLGGYVAYGQKDKEWKYRGDIIYSFLPKDRDVWEFPKRLVSFSYVDDLNIPGEDLLTTKRDFILNSLSHKSIRRMSRQKISVLNYKHELEDHLSFTLEAKYLNDRPVGNLEYMTIENNVRTEVKGFTTGEVSFAIRYAPHEVFFQTREKRRYFRKGDVELNFKHRMGLKGFLGSDYNYHITDFDAYKEFTLPNNIGKLDLKLAGRKVWDRLPFPLLFVAGGNQSYIFRENDYNLMNYSEFVTDRFIAGNLNLKFNWSPFSLFFKNKIKTNLGAKAIYGPMSDDNDPNLHSGLFAFNEGIKPLEDDPYLEVNIGFSNILKIFRIEWVQRLTYLEKDQAGKKKHKGSIFVNASFAF